MPTFERGRFMNKQFPSLSHAITASSLSLPAFIGYTLMEFRYFLEKWIPGTSAAMAELVIVLLIAGGWLRALLVAASGRRSGLTALVGFSAFGALIGLYDMQYVLGTPMPWPEQVTVLSILLVSVIAAVVVARYTRRTKSPS